MKAKKSPLELLDFEILQANMQFITPDKDEVDLDELFSGYSIDVDFSLGGNMESGLHRIQAVIIVNGQKSDSRNVCPGYSLVVEGGGTFRIAPGVDINEQERNNLVLFSTLNVVIGCLRNAMQQLTTQGPMGPYILPPIDIVDLIHQKQELTEKDD